MTIIIKMVVVVLKRVKKMENDVNNVETDDTNYKETIGEKGEN